MDDKSKTNKAIAKNSLKKGLAKTSEKSSLVGKTLISKQKLSRSLNSKQLDSLGLYGKKSQFINVKLAKDKSIPTPIDLSLSTTSLSSSNVDSSFSPVKFNVPTSNTLSESSTSIKSSNLFKKGEQSRRNSLSIIVEKQSISRDDQPKTIDKSNISPVIITAAPQQKPANKKESRPGSKNFYIELFKKMMGEYFYSSDFISFVGLNFLTIAIVLVIKWIRNR